MDLWRLTLVSALLRNVDDMPETFFVRLIGFEIATKLYPHQKKALTFLLDREKEQEAPGGFSSLWQKRCHQLTGRTTWLNVITQKEVYEAPKEPKGAILADDVRYPS
jgi:hypothetical protein